MKLSTRMREMLWDLLAYKRNPKGILIIGDERTARALVCRGLLRSDPDGYVLDEKAARRALKAA